MRRATLAGVETIEHGDGGTPEVFRLMKERNVALCPTLAIAPGDDPIHTIDHYRVLKEKIPDCEFIVYEGLPHNITDAVPDRCAEDYRRFLLKHRRAA